MNRHYCHCKRDLCKKRCNKCCHKKRPNVIVILTDDAAWANLGSSGDPYMQQVVLPGETTPGGTKNLDRLMQEGVSFTNFYSSPICTATRSGLNTGRYPFRTGATQQVGPEHNTATNQIVLGERFKNTGYRTYMNGKYDLGATPGFIPQDRGYDKSLWFKGPTNICTDNGWDMNFIYSYNLFRGDKPELFEFDTISEDTYIETILMNDAIDFIENPNKGDENKPFFMYLNPFAMHWPTIAIPEWRDAFKNISLNGGLPGYDNLGAPIENSFFDDPRNFAGLAEYYAGISFVDKQIGRLRSYLKSKGLEDDTMIIYTTDNGMDERPLLFPFPCGLPSGELVTPGQNPTPIPPSNWESFINAVPGEGTGAFGNYYDGFLRGFKGAVNSPPYEGGVKAPLFWYWPKGQIKGGEISNTLGSTLDLVPTLIDLCKLKSFPNEKPLDGKSLKNSLKRPDVTEPGKVFITETPGLFGPIKYRLTVVMKNTENFRWRLIGTSNNGSSGLDQLFELNSDPQQTTPLDQSDPQYVPIVNELNAIYDQYFASISGPVDGYANPETTLAKRAILGNTEPGKEFLLSTITSANFTDVSQTNPPFPLFWIKNQVHMYFGRIPSEANSGLGELNFDRANKPEPGQENPKLSCLFSQVFDSPYGARDFGNVININVQKTGNYIFKLRRFPVDRTITTGHESSDPNSPDYYNYLFPYDDNTPITFGDHYSKAVVELGTDNRKVHKVNIIPGTEEALLHIQINITGSTQLRCYFERTGNDIYTGEPLKNRDVPYMYITYLG